MGALTVQEILDEGGLLAGDDSQEERALIWFNNWMDKTNRGWMFPHGKKRIAGLPLAAQATSVSVGAGTVEALRITRIFEPVYVYTSDFSKRLRAEIRELLDQPVNFDESSRPTSYNFGTPTAFKLRADLTTYGKWSLIPFPIPDRAFLLAFDCQVLPPRLALSDIPIYPEDRTLIQAAKCAVLEYSDGPASEALGAELEILSNMVKDDRINFGDAAGDGQYWTLDGSMFE